MKYYIQRGVNEYGPYTLADLQRYVAQGNIAMTDLTRSEGMTDWVPVSQVIGNIPVPVAPLAAGGAAYPGAPAAGPVYGAVPVYGTTTGQAGTAGPIPPDFHWALVLLIGSFTCGIFTLVWLFIEAAFVRKLRPGNKGMLLYIVGLVVQAGGFFLVIAVAAVLIGQGREDSANALGVLVWLFSLAGAVLIKVGDFQLRKGLLEYYNTVEPINLRLSSVMTFFFAVFYFQYHFTRIVNWKKTGYLEPQS
jgi:GYF domain 2